MDGRAASLTITDRIPYLLSHGLRLVALSCLIGKADKKFPHYRTLSPFPSGLRFEMRHLIGKGSIFRKLLLAVISVLLLPFLFLEKVFIQLDSQWSWVFSATPVALFIAWKHKPDVIYSSAGPPSSHVTALILSRLTGIPWVCELHDPLLIPRKTWQNKKFHEWLEGAIMKYSVENIWFTEKARDSIAARFPLEKAGIVIRPGANPPEVLLTYQKSSCFNISHFGSLADDRNLTTIINVLSKIILDEPHLQKSIRLNIYGCKPDIQTKSAIDQNPDLKDVIICHGRLEKDPITGKDGRQRVAEAMHLTDLLLIVQGTQPIFYEYIPSKMYDYFYASRPILGLGLHDSEFQQVLTEHGHIAVDEQNITQVKNTLVQQIHLWESSAYTFSNSNKALSVENATVKLISILITNSK